MEKSFVNPAQHSADTVIIYKSGPIGNIIAVSVGTSLLFIARNLPEPSLAKFWLTMISPAVSVFSTWFWKKLSSLYAMLSRRIEQWDLNKKIASAIKAALKNPHITYEEKKKLERERMKLKLEEIDALIQKLRAIRKEDA